MMKAQEWRKRKKQLKVITNIKLILYCHNAGLISKGIKYPVCLTCVCIETLHLR